MSPHTEAGLHTGILDAQEQLRQGRISRRAFLRLATLLGASLPTATLLAGCGNAAPASNEDEPTAAPAPTAPASVVPRGGTLRIGMPIQAVDHPARFSWTEPANVFRHVFEYLTETDARNITHPLLLRNWQSSHDLRTWTLNLRQGLRWTNGDELVAEHVYYNFETWLDPAFGSSILGLWEGFLTIDGVEVVDAYTVRLNLSKPKLDVPESLFHYPAQIVHPDFDGAADSGDNPSIGPFLLDDYVTGDFARLVRRDDYWQVGVDGRPLPYLDTIEFIDLGTEQINYISALERNLIHSIYDPRPGTLNTLRNAPNLAIYSVDTSQARVLRMRVDTPPWDDNRVRRALTHCQRRDKIIEQAFYGRALPGGDFHVSPVQPEYAPMELPPYDPEAARELLAAAGFADGLDVSIAVGTGWTDAVDYVEQLREDAREAGITIAIDAMPNTEYWDIWTTTTVGVTAWTHRPLAVMLLPLAYTADSNGNPVPWNETRWVDDEFSRILQQAQGTVDIEARRAMTQELQRIQMQRGSIGIAYWQRVWEIYNPAFQGIVAHPTLFNFLLREVWYDESLDPHARRNTDDPDDE